ncbi:MAG: phosphotransferase, partial [Desulfobacterales bacterium]
LKAFKPANGYWRDLGTPRRYAETVFEKMSAQAFEKIASSSTPTRITKNKLKGDGSDRKWYRLTRSNTSLVMVDHGLRMTGAKNEADAFVAIGNHLHTLEIRVPKILLFDTFAGLVFLEDLGDTNLQMMVRQAKGSAKIISYYQAVVDSLIQMCLSGAEGFDPAWTCQSSRYSRELILEKECRYFIEAFVSGYVGIDAKYEDLADEFRRLADGALNNAVTGFMHRDLQSRNIMYKNDRFYFIDFQGGRLGPLQYDLASLLIDPYVGLTNAVQNQLLEYGFEKLRPLVPIRPDEFKKNYQYCCLTRNLQILGAFGYLSRVKQKTYFENYIPRAVETLRNTLSLFDDDELPHLKMMADRIKNTLIPQ